MAAAIFHYPGELRLRQAITGEESIVYWVMLPAAIVHMMHA